MPDNKDDGKNKEQSKSVDTVTDKNRKDWNNYYAYLKKNNLSGNADLDKGEGANNEGIKTLQKYIKDNPKTSLTVDLIPAIQQDFSNYRQFALQDIKSGHSAFASGVNEDNFMKELSIVDGQPGSKTTKHIFPERYINYMGQKQNKGFGKEGQGNLYATN